MENKKSMKPLAVAVGAAFAASLSGVQVVNAAENPFALSELSSGYMVADKGEGRCGEGKCGGKTMTEGKCGEGKCGADRMKHKAKEGKCGEGKCGGKKMEKMKEGKCGEGKCGGMR